ncbi:ParB/RepB/Spo0J family partition protein [Pseudoduganella umbonata]|nr:ParB N-terminal domain-containing protein [Pseudoduganella umbonata]MBB3221667.1 ParB family chromosome partitioning protein [Pseudoduganella umbonata]
MAAVLNMPESVVSPIPMQDNALALRHATMARAMHAQLARSRYNVRRKRTPLAELKALIRSQGLLQNLVGFWQIVDGVPTGRIEIVAGERRMDSIGELIAEGELPSDYEIIVLIVSEQEAIGISLAENMGREPMHPADVFDAMFALASAGRDADELALAFGTDTAAVRRWLRLARVAPTLLDLYRKDQANYEQMAALAVSEDQDAQVRAWEGLPPHERSAWRLNNLLTVGEINVRTDRVARFVGIAALEQAGAVIRKDLFSEQGDGYLTDAALLEDLAVARLERLAQRVRREGHAWVAVVLRADHAFVAGYGRAPLRDIEPDDAQKAQLAAIDAERERVLATTSDPLTDKQHAARERQLRSLRERRQAIERALVVPEEAFHAVAGALVTIDSDGRPVIHRHLIRPQDKVPAQPAKAQRGERPAHPERLVRHLTAHRTMALAATVLQQPHVALALAVQALWRNLYGRGSGVAKIQMVPFACPSDVAEGPAARTMAAREQGFNPQTLPTGLPLAWFASLTQELLLEMLALAVARSIDAVQSGEGAHAGFDEVANEVGLDMRQWWQPTADGYFAYLTKARLVELVSTTVSKEAAVPLEGTTKEVAAQLAQQVFAGTGWLPALLRSREEAAVHEVSDVGEAEESADEM